MIDKEIFAHLADFQKHGIPVCLATIVNAAGSTLFFAGLFPEAINRWRLRRKSGTQCSPALPAHREAANTYRGRPH